MTASSFSRILLPSVILCLLAAGCGKSAMKQNEEAAEELIQCWEDYATALESVKDKETAKAAAEKIDAAAQRLDKLMARKDEIPKVTETQHKELTSKYTPKIQAASARAVKAIITATLKSAGEPTFAAAMKRMEASMPKAD